MIPAWFEGDLAPGARGDAVLIVQRKLRAPLTGVMDEDTLTRVRGFQRLHGMEQTGMVNKKTAKKLGNKAAAGQVPDWYEHDLNVGDSCRHVQMARVALRLSDLPPVFDQEASDALRRFQSEKGLKTSGVLDETAAVALGDRMA